MTLYKWTNQDGSSCNGGSGKWPLPKRLPDGSWAPGGAAAGDAARVAARVAAREWQRRRLMEYITGVRS